MNSVTAPDGTTTTASITGSGPQLLVIHPGLDDGSSWERVAAQLARRFTVMTFTRRQYRGGLTASVSILDEVSDVIALCQAAEEPTLVVGHSSGGVVALEALATRPDLFLAGVVYEAPIETADAPMDLAAVAAASQALSKHRPARAVQIFARDIVGLPPVQAALARLFTAVSPRLRRLAPHQLADVKAIQALGTRLDTYARITSPILLLGGSDSPDHLTRRLDALETTLPHATRVTMNGQGHSAQQRAPHLVARAIEDFHDTLAATKDHQGHTPC